MLSFFSFEILLAKTIDEYCIDGILHIAVILHLHVVRAVHESKLIVDARPVHGGLGKDEAVGFMADDQGRRTLNPTACL